MFECIYLGLYKFKKEKLSNILLVFGVITCITLSVPFINMDKLSEINQMARVFKVDDPENDLTDEQKAKIRGAYYYIKNYLPDGYNKIDEIFSDDEQEIIINFNYKKQNSEPEKETKYMYRSKELDFVSIDNYSKLYNLDYYLSSYRSEALDEDYLYELEDNKFIDLKPLIAKLIEISYYSYLC